MDIIGPSNGTPDSPVRSGTSAKSETVFNSRLFARRGGGMEGSAKAVCFQRPNRLARTLKAVEVSCRRCGEVFLETASTLMPIGPASTLVGGTPHTRLRPGLADGDYAPGCSPGESGGVLGVGRSLSSAATGGTPFTTSSPPRYSMSGRGGPNTASGSTTTSASRSTSST